MYIIITYFITFKVIDFISEGLEQAKAAMIITRKGTHLSNEIYKRLGRTTTTIKGKGLSYAEANREFWHAGGPFNVEDGSPKFKFSGNDTTVFDSLKNLLDTNPKAVVLNILKK